MNKKLIVFGLLIGVTISSIVSYVKADDIHPVTIFVQVKSLYSNYSNYKSQYDADVTDNGNYDTESTKKLGAGYFRSALGVDGNAEWAEKGAKDIYADIPEKVLKPGQFAFSYNQSDVTVSPAISGGYGKYSNKLSLSDINSSATYQFSFKDNSKVQLVIAAYNEAGNDDGCITGKIEYLNTDYINEEVRKNKGSGLSYIGDQNAYGSYWYATDWYRKDKTTPVNGKAYTMGGLSIKQNSNSSTLEITNLGEGTKASTIAVTVYIGCTEINTNLGTASYVSKTSIDSGAKMDNGSTQASADNTPVDNGNGNADEYAVDTNYDNQIGIFNNWQVVQSYVNSLIDTITMVSYFYFGIAFLTSILMLIYNIVAIAGATSNPMVRTRLFMRFGISVLCLALLGGSALLARLFILTCMGG